MGNFNKNLTCHPELDEGQAYDPVKEKEAPMKKEGYKKTKLGWIPEEWEVRLLGEFYDFKNGLNKEKEFFGYGTPIINYMDVHKNIYLKESDVKGRVSLNDNEIKRFNIKKGDVFFTRTSETIDEIAYSTVLLEDIPNGVFSGFILRARPKDTKILKIEYAQYCFSTPLVRKQIKRKSTFTTRALTNGRFLSEVNLFIPPIKEQQKIATILSTWDRAIAKQEQLIAEKQDYKKGLMQLLLTGKLRFPGFEGEWEEKELKEIGEVIRGASPRPKGSPKYYGGNVPRLMVQDVTRDGKYVTPQIDFLTELGATKSRPCKKGTLTVVCSGEVGTPSFLAVDACIHDGFLAILNIDKNVNEDFLYNQLLRLKSRLERSATHGGVFTNLTTTILKEFKVEVPSLQEQQKIASVLGAADAEIQLLETELAQLRDQKRGLMQRLLTGEVRVKM